MSGIKTAVALLVQALEQQQRITIVGDYDADGATSTAVAIRALRLLGYRHVDYLVPNRFVFGYGLSPALVAEALKQQPGLLLTVDNGISSVDGVAVANAAGVKVLITDHHLAGEILPAAAAIVNPNLPGDHFASKSLAGVGVIFYLMLALRAELKANGWFASARIEAPNLASLLDLVALGTVADLVPLDYNNRILVQQGLARMRSGHAQIGIKALLQCARREPQRLMSQDLGFALGPRLNAAGRMDDMSIGIECLITDDPQRAMQLAQQLEQLNQERRATGDEMQQQAATLLNAIEGRLDPTAGHMAITLYDPDWHEGVIGILASRIKERWHRPVVILTQGEGADEIKGSARSIPGFHMRDALALVDVRHPALMTRFGGHAMAAGMALPMAHLQLFMDAFEQVARERLRPEDVMQIHWSDGDLTPAECSVAFVETINRIIPWGMGMDPPRFDGRFELFEFRWVGEVHLKMRLRWPSGEEVDAIYFSAREQWPEPALGYYHCLYRPDINHWRGMQTLQLFIDGMMNG